MQINLTRGFATVIDDEDWELVKDFKWTAIKCKGCIYAVTYFRVDGKRAHVLMHRLITGVSRSFLVDHKDGDGLNNRRANLRQCSRSQNAWNSKVRSHSKSGLKCVYEVQTKSGPRWRACVRCYGKRYRKQFVTSADAVSWADEMRARLHGEFAYDKSADSRLSGT